MDDIVFNNGEAGEDNLREGSERDKQGEGDRCSAQMVLLQPLRAPPTYAFQDLVNHYRFMKTTLVGRIMAPIAKWFNILEMRFQLDTFQQQGLVTLTQPRPPRTGSSTSTSTCEGTSSSNTWPVRGTSLPTQSPPLPLDPQGPQEGTLLQSRLRSSRLLRPRARP